jgi:hypothetical protein
MLVWPPRYTPINAISCWNGSCGSRSAGCAQWRFLSRQGCTSLRFGWTWGREPPWHAQFSELQGESGQLEKDADELKREARVLLDQAMDNPVDAARLRSEAKARLEQAVEKLKEAIRLTERADRHIRRQMPTVDAEEWISQLLPDPEHLARERNSLKGEIEAADR